MSSEPIRPMQADSLAWQSLESLVDEIAERSASCSATLPFYRDFLERTCTAVAARGGAVWLQEPSGLRLEYQMELEAAGLVANRVAQSRHGQLLHGAMQTSGAQAIAPRSGSRLGDESTNPSDHRLLLCPIRVNEAPVGVVELFCRPDMDPSAERGALRLLAAVCALAGDFHRNLELRRLREREPWLEQLLAFGRLVHGSLDVRATGFVIANEVRRLTGVDRVSVAARRVRGWEMIAISGVDVMDRRANVVQLAERLVRCAAATCERLTYPEPSSEFAPQISDAVRDYVDESHAAYLHVMPLVGDGDEDPPIGYLVLEQLEGEVSEALADRAEALGSPSRLALRNALRHQQSPWERFAHGSARKWTMIAGSAIVIVVLALGLIPGELVIEATGELQPSVRREVFAPVEGNIVTVLVEQDARVSAGDELALMISPRLDVEYQRVLGEQETTRKRLDALESERIELDAAQTRDRKRSSLLTAEKEQAFVLLASQQKQLEILDQQRAALRLKSPIDGMVLTWDIEPLLRGRPVQQGDVVMTVADTAQPWLVELQIPDAYVGHVLDARGEADEDLPVSFLLATDMSQTYEGRLTRVARTISRSVGQSPVAEANVSFDQSANSAFRPGTTVIAKIRCGRRALGYVWFHDLIDALLRRLRF